MNPSTAAEDLVVAKCSDCGLYRRGLTQAEGIKFRAEHQQHEGNMLYAEPVAPPPASGFQPSAAAERLNTLAEALGAQAESVRAQLRSVAPTGAEEVTRLQSRHADDLRTELALTVGAVDSLLGTVAQAGALLSEVAPQLTATLDRLAAAKREGVAGLDNLGSLPELFEERMSAEREDLATCQQAVDRVRRALTRLEPITPLFLAAVARYVRAASARMAQHEVARATARITALKVELETLRLPSVGLREAVVLAARAATLTGEVVAVPTLVWPMDLLIPPTLTDA